MACKVCHEERCVPIAIIIPYIGLDGDGVMINENPLHAAMCWHCGTVRILDHEKLKKIASDHNKILIDT
jgi:hypothetical protein